MTVLLSYNTTCKYLCCGIDRNDWSPMMKCGFNDIKKFGWGVQRIDRARGVLLYLGDRPGFPYKHGSRYLYHSYITDSDKNHEAGWISKDLAGLHHRHDVRGSSEAPTHIHR
jgi:hypothetical protein